MFDVKTLEDQIDETHFIDRLMDWSSTAFGILATLLASIGLYGITAYSVARRTPEIGIRVALGAKHGNVFRMIMREVLILIAIGVFVAVPLMWWLAKITSSELFEIKPNDPFVISAALLVITLVSAIAGLVPARRAAQIDPIKALKYE